MNRTVLVVEDEIDLAGLLGEVLESAGYAVEFTTAGQALQRARATRPVLVVTDYLMPGGNGAEVAREIRGAGGPAPPILLVSGLDHVADLAQSMAADAYIRKPFDVDTFLQMVGRLAG